MPHVCFIPMSGLRVRENELLELGMTLPGLVKRANALAELPALGLITLAGMNPPGWTSSYHSNTSDIDSLIEDVMRHRPHLVAVSALTASVLDAYKLSQEFRKQSVPTVLGGLHATACPTEAAQYFDAVVVGDGESSWPKVLHDCEAGQLDSIYRPTAPFSLRNAPPPRFDLLGGNPQRRYTMQTSRGCPFDCDFCGASRLLGNFREKPIDRIEAEIDAICRFEKRPWVELADDNSFVTRNHSIQLLDRLSESPIRYFTEADWRIGERPEVLDRLARSGCMQVLVGIESLVFRYPGMGAKRAELDRIMNSIDAIQDAGVVVNGCFIIGANGETTESLDRLIEFVLSSSLAEVQITIETPFPGTELFRKMKASDRLLRDRDWSHYTLFDVVFQPDQMSVADLEEGFRRVLSEVFSESASDSRNEIRSAIWRNHPKIRTASLG